MSIPKHVRDSIRLRLFEECRAIDWVRLTAAQKSKHYEAWTWRPDVGGTLANYMDAGKVRVYIKDTLLKSYTRDYIGDCERIKSILGLDDKLNETESFIKPHGRIFGGRYLVCWGKADDWKTVVMAAFERATYFDGLVGTDVVLLLSAMHYFDMECRSPANLAAQKLGLNPITWVE